MNDKDIFKKLIEVGWTQEYQRHPLIKYYRFKAATPSGAEYFYLDRDSDDARICMNPKYAEHQKTFSAISGTRVGGDKNGQLLLKSSNMRDFQKAIGRTGDKIPEFFPIAFDHAEALSKVIKLLHGTDRLSAPHSIENASAAGQSDSNDKRGATKKSLVSALASASTQIDAEYANKPGEDVDAIVKRRIGQGPFRNLLLDLYGSSCCLSGLANNRLLIASHIVPWSKASPTQKTDPENGLLLSVSWDALFDKGFASFDDNGNLLRSDALDHLTAQRLGVSMEVKLPADMLTADRKKNLALHRQNHGFKIWLVGGISG